MQKQDQHMSTCGQSVNETEIIVDNVEYNVGYLGTFCPQAREQRAERDIEYWIEKEPHSNSQGRAAAILRHENVILMARERAEIEAGSDTDSSDETIKDEEEAT